MSEEGVFVDARGLSCPQPVIMTRKALESAAEGRVTAVVDNEVARDNIVKMARSLSCEVDIDRAGSDYYIHITRPEHFSTRLQRQETQLFVFSSDCLGRGSEELGRTLMKNFFYSLCEQGGLGKVLIFLNGGVRLTCTGSPVLDYLIELQQDGAAILTCGTCLDYYQLRSSLGVGEVTNMYAIVEYLQQCPRVVFL
ncbi:SirA-like response regulator protein [Thermacetogenium phaeum DSM 12270]|uniref:SirA-like response regulator protein n=1 Tax=Thermacetogenium phaeum (strain ATCC BAA-254 / DSM 26808 / PB) TaxID=1089553 RepID=K4LE32_THEPS|nr:sulfurtransferase-like selenium metabolism protein YedF [Thermacetogenium phaeum]AFV10317.1 SirA-like response regulator protein [Thermacetogenium phaeum DSM 12270]